MRTVSLFGPAVGPVAESTACADRYVAVLRSSFVASETRAFLQTLPHNRFAICVPPFFDGELGEVVQLAEELGCDLIVGLRVAWWAFRDGTRTQYHGILASLEFDDCVWMVEDLLHEIEGTFQEVYLSIGVGTSESLESTLLEGAQFSETEWNYVTTSELRRLASVFNLHLGGAVRSVDQRHLLPPNLGGLFTTLHAAFEATGNHIDYASIPDSESLEAVTELRRLSDSIGR